MFEYHFVFLRITFDNAIGKVSIEAVTAAGTAMQKEFTLSSLASEKIIVRASNPGQFEPDAEATWQKDPGSDTVYHLGW